MDEIKARIKQYAQTYNSTLDNEALLDLVVLDVVNRALSYTNRQQLVYAFEEAKTTGVDPYDVENAIELPIPKELETVLAGVVITAYRNVAIQNTATTGNVKSISDNGQSISFGDNATAFNTDDHTLFGTALVQLDRYRLGSTLKRALV
jgi:hypothetical protein